MDVTPVLEGGEGEPAVALIKVDLHGTVVMMSAKEIWPTVAVEVGDSGATVLPPGTERSGETDAQGDVGKGVGEGRKWGENEKERKKKEKTGGGGGAEMHDVFEGLNENDELQKGRECGAGLTGRGNGTERRGGMVDGLRQCGWWFSLFGMVFFLKEQQQGETDKWR